MEEKEKKYETFAERKEKMFLIFIYLLNQKLFSKKKPKKI